jgi:hypothetical protein
MAGAASKRFRNQWLTPAELIGGGTVNREFAARKNRKNFHNREIIGNGRVRPG